jgi:hypothetical protein
MIKRLSLKILILTCSLIQSVIVLSQEQITIPGLIGEFKFDGMTDDVCWQNVKPLPMVMHIPVFGNQPSENTEVMVCYDNTYLYVGARLYDSNPSDMLVSSKKRDESVVASEGFILILDSFNDKENGLAFGTTPTGLRNDFTIFKDAMVATREGPFNQSWNTFWDVKTSRNELGWFVEMRIPFSSIRFKDDAGKVVMGLTCLRILAHKNEIDVFPSIPPNWGKNSCYRPSKAQEVLFEGLSSKRPFYIAPYAIAGYQQDYSLNESGTEYQQNNSPKLNAGLDIKYGLTNNLTADITVNTDFAQVEADDEQINLTRFSLFFPEKRTFFQERSSIFSFDFEQGSSLFYSRRIGLHEGEQVPIIAGARVTGMAGRWDIGFMDMQTQAINQEEGSENALPSENFGILRLRRQVINENSYMGGVVTSRVGMDGSYNTAYGIDGIIKLFENDYLNIKLAQVMDNSYTNDFFSLDPTRLYINWNRFNDKGLNYDFAWSRSGKDFIPEIGFQIRNNYTLYSTGIGYGWIPGEAYAMQNHKVGIKVTAYQNNLDNSAESVETMFTYNFRFKSDYNGTAYIRNQYENVLDTFSLSDNTYIPTGKYSFTYFETHLNSPSTNPFVMGVDLFTGGFYDGKRFGFGLEPAWNIGSTLQLALTYDHNFLSFKERNQSFSEGILGFKALVMFDTKLSASTFIQYNSAENDLISNFRFRYNPREGNDFYVVFNEGRSTYRDIVNPRMPLFNYRSILLKYTYTFTL